MRNHLIPAQADTPNLAQPTRFGRGMKPAFVSQFKRAQKLSDRLDRTRRLIALHQGLSKEE